MKTNKVLTLVLATCLFFVAACKDDNTDYRDSWVGTYVGDCSYHFSNGADYQYDTVFHNETLAVSKNEDNGLIVDFRSMELSVQCTKDGEIPASTAHPHSNYFGHFKGDSLFFEYSDVSQGNASLLSFRGRKE